MNGRPALDGSVVESTTAKPIPHSRPTLGPEEATAVATVLEGGILVGGERLAAFEEAVAALLGRRKTVALTSGSTALYLALRAVGVGPGDQVALPSYACISLLQAIRRAGADPLPVDCDPATFQLDPEDLRRRLTARTRAVLAVHAFGRPAPVEALLEMGPTVVEDVATALGARRDGRTVGGDGGSVVCSFNATKMITTGGGGAVVGDDPAFMSRVADLVDYDQRNDATVRYNERMGEMAASLGLAQLRRLDDFLERRRTIAGIYREELEAAPILLPPPEAACEPAWHRFVVRLARGADRVRSKLSGRGIASPRPVHQPIHRILGRRGFPGAETAHREALSLPIYPSLDDDDARRVAREVRQCLDDR